MRPRRIAVAVLALGLVVTLGGCRGRAVRVLVDARLQRPMEEALALFEMRTGHRLRATYATRERVEILLNTGAHDALVIDLAQAEAHPVTALLELSTARPLARGDEVTFGCVLRHRAPERPAVLALWRFLQEEEVAALLRAAGFRPVAVNPGAASAPRGQIGIGYLVPPWWGQIGIAYLVPLGWGQISVG